MSLTNPILGAIVIGVPALVMFGNWVKNRIVSKVGAQSQVQVDSCVPDELATTHDDHHLSIPVIASSSKYMDISIQKRRPTSEGIYKRQANKIILPQNVRTRITIIDNKSNEVDLYLPINLDIMVTGTTKNDTSILLTWGDDLTPGWVGRVVMIVDENCNEYHYYKHDPSFVIMAYTPLGISPLFVISDETLYRIVLIHRCDVNGDNCI